MAGLGLGQPGGVQHLRPQPRPRRPLPGAPGASAGARWSPTTRRTSSWPGPVRTRRPGFAITPPGRRPVYYVTLYSYPRLPFSYPLGADARAIPGILASLEHARDTGETTVSNQTTLPGDMNLPAARRPVAFELFVPVYEVERPTPAQRRSRFLGWATGQFRAEDSLEDALVDLSAADHHHRGRAARRGGRRQPDRQLPARLPGRGTGRARGAVQPSAAAASCCATPPCPATRS